jgi:tRNA modification GTPase
MQARAHEVLGRADVILRCFPGDEPAFEPLVPAHEANGERALTIDVRTKCDVLAMSPVANDDNAIMTSARTGAGIAELRTVIAGAIAKRAPRTAHELSLGIARIALLKEAALSLDDALATGAPELVADALRTALDRLGEVSGAIPPDDVLGRLFSSFCIGK